MFHSKAQRYAHLRHYHKLVYDADASKAQHSAPSQPANVDTWIDLATAIQRVAEHTTQIDNPLYTLALYSLITQVKTNDVIELFGNGLSTIHKVRRRLKATLAQELPGYGQFTDNKAKPLSLPRIRSFQLAQLNKKPISDHFFTDTPTYNEYIKTNSFYDESMQSSPVIHAEHLDTHQQISVSEQLYPTAWRGQCTLEEILNDTRVRRVAYSKMQSLGNFDEDADDCFQIGSIRLWKTLQQCPDLLIGKSAGWLGVWIAHSGSRHELWKHRVRKAQFDNPEFDLETADERLELSPRNRKEQWANFATRADERIDFELLMSTLAQQYDGDPLKLFALYSLTTSVNMKSVLPVVHAHKNQMIQARRAVKEDMQMLIEAQSDRDVSEEFWTHDTTSEAALVAIQRVAERVLDNERLLLALYIVTTSAKRKDVTKLFGIGITWFRREVILVKALLAEEMRKQNHDYSNKKLLAR